MTEKISIGDSVILVVMAVMIAAWGIAGALDVSERTEAGLSTNSSHVITWLAPGGPAEMVNMKVGDQILRIESTDIGDTSNILRLPRVAAGERRSYVIQRGDQTTRYQPAFRHLPLRVQWLEHLATVVGFGFLLIPLAACLTQHSIATRVLALMGLGISLSFFDGPYLVSYDIRAVATVVAQLFMLLGIAAMVHFLLVFPDRRPLLERSWGKKLIYWPMLLIWFLMAWKILFIPPAASVAGFAGQFISGLGVTVYLITGLYLLLRNYSRSDRQERKALALNRMLWATVAAIIPAVVAHLASLVSPGTPLPGQDYYFAALVLIPMAWSLSAARKQNKPAEPAFEA